MGVYFQNHRWPLVSKIWKPSKNHWKQWSGGWKSLNGDGWMTPKPLKNHRVQWSVIKKVVNGDGQRGAKPSKNHWSQWFSQEKTIVSHRSQKMTIVHLYTHKKFTSPSSIPQTNGKRGVFSSSAGFLIVTPNFQYQNEKNELHPTRATLSRNFLAEQVFPWLKMGRKKTLVEEICVFVPTLNPKVFWTSQVMIRYL